MRIISGSLKGKRITAPHNLPVRPTTDIAKESLFNIINNNYDIDDLKVLDLFAGIGSITYEFASRGAESITSVDKEFKCISFIKKTVEECKFDNVKVVKADAFRYLKYDHPKFSLIFADPPYDLEGIEEIPLLVFGNNLLHDQGMLIIEHSREVSYADNPNYIETRKYGKVNFSFFEVK